MIRVIVMGICRHVPCMLDHLIFLSVVVVYGAVVDVFAPVFPYTA